MKRFVTLFSLFVTSVGLVVAQTTPDGSASSRLGFGGSTAVSGGSIFVGSAPIGWPSGSDPAGTIHRYAQDDEGNWIEVEVIGASDAEYGDEFGRAFTVDGSTMLVSAPRKNTVYVFEWDGDSWNESGQINPGDALAEGEEFGGAYARGGYRTQTMAPVGDGWAIASYNGTTNEGSIHWAHKMGDSWHVMGGMQGVNAWSVVSDGSRLFSGSPFVREGKGGIAVSVLSEDGTWSTQGLPRSAELTENARLGSSLALVGNRLFAGAPGHDRFGAVLVFEHDEEGKWTHVHTLTSPEPMDEEARRPSAFGRGIDATDTHLFVGSNRVAFVYDLSDLGAQPEWIQAPAQQAGNGFGVGIGIEGGVAVVGAPDADYGSGLAHIYEQQENGSWAYTDHAAAAVERMASITGTEKQECEDGIVEGLFPCDGVDLISMVSTDVLANDRGANLNDIWGWTDPESDREFVLAGRTDGTSFIEITDPANPVVIGQVMRTEGSPGAWWRDVKTYQNYAYIVADGSGDHGMQVFDMNRLLDVDPADMPVDFEPDMTYRGVASSHNIVINEETGFGYAVGSDSGGESCGGQLHMIDLNEPGNPQFVGCYTHPDFGGTHDSQCVIYRGSDADYVGREICLNSNGRAFIIADVTDKADPQTVTVAEYPNTAYTHQGWLSEDHNYFYMNDELDEMNQIVPATRTLVWDMSDLDEPILVNEFYHDNGASDHNLYVHGNLMYQSNYQAGLRILDITDPENPVPVGHFDTAPYADNVHGFAGSWSNYPYFKSGIIVVSSQAEGVFMLRRQEQDL